MPHEAEIRTVSADTEVAIDPNSIVVQHHRAGMAEIRLEQLTGGRLLHLALAGCVFNNVLRLARQKGISVDEASIRVSGDFTADGDSTGIDCEVKVLGGATPEQLRALAREAFDNSTVGVVLKRATKVELLPSQG